MPQELAGTFIGLLLVAIPFWKIHDRTGVAKGWILLLLIPGLGIFFLWLVLARARWTPRAVDAGR